MMKKSEPKWMIPKKAPVSKTLRNLTSNEAFHFYIGIGNPTNKTATSLMDFVEKLRTVDVRSVEFHFQRQDFEKWLKDTVGDQQLSRRIGEIGKKDQWRNPPKPDYRNRKTTLRRNKKSVDGLARAELELLCRAA
jgi:hypothetical protein